MSKVTKLLPSRINGNCSFKQFPNGPYVGQEAFAPRHSFYANVQNETDPHRAIFCRNNHPGVRLLRANKLSPREREWAIESIANEMLHSLEN